MTTFRFEVIGAEMKRLYYIVVASLCLFLFVGCRHFETPPEQHVSQTVSMSLAILDELVGDRTVTINEDIVVGGYVITSDQESNFYKTLIIDDGTAAAELMLGIYDSYRLYPPGYYISVRLQGCGVGHHYGVMQIGMPADTSSGYPTEYFLSRVLLDEHISSGVEYRDIEPLVCSIDQLENISCGRLVCIEGLSLVSNLYSDVWNVNQEGVWAGYNIFQDEAEKKVAVYTSEYADYDGYAVPTGEVAITGVLQKGRIDGDDMFMIKMRYEDDCVATK